MKKTQPSKPSAEKWGSLPDFGVKTEPKDKEETLPAPSPKEKYFHRDLSWLHFNDRVLSEAADDSVPALERLRFAGIVSSNLDEFFMVRVAEIMKKAVRRSPTRVAGKLSAPRVLTQIRDHVLHQKSRQAAVLHDLLSTLIKEGIIIYTEFHDDKELDRDIRSRLPKIDVMVHKSSEPLPYIVSDLIHVFVRFPEEYAILRMETRQSRMLKLPSQGTTLRYVLLERWLAARSAELFPGKEVVDAFPFKIIRDADLRYRPDEEDTLEEQIFDAIEKRTKARVVRLEVDAPAYSEAALFVASGLGLSSASLYRFALPLDLRALAKVYNAKAFNRLRYPPVRPQTPPFLKSSRNLFACIKERDILLHHPYDDFDIIVRFLKQAAKDPDVTSITHTLYRTSRESPVMEALQEAVKNGKKVTAYIEIKARFDELNNLHWAEELRRAGVRVIKPFGGFKVHSKLTQVIRKENGEYVSYLHLGTGNYHPGTARQYSDLGLLTCDPQLGKEISVFFSALTKKKRPAGLSDLMVAPGNLHSQFEKLIREETEIQRNGGRGHIIAKMNSLVDKNIINTLYEASQVGVKIELLVRGICCLRPGIKGLSENIKIISIVDRFLEHSRLYYFRANGMHKTYMASADWMPRNFYTRYEVAFPIKDLELKKFLREVVLATSLADNTKSWVLKPDGTYHRVTPQQSGKSIRSQFAFEEMAKRSYQQTILEHRPKKKKA